MEWIAQISAPLLHAIKERYPASSHATLRSWIQQGRVSVDGIVSLRPNTLVQQGQSLDIVMGKTVLQHYEGKSCAIVYEDESLIVVDKYAGSLSVATDSQTLHTVHAELKRHYYPKKVFVIHRLDRGTSGLMLFARDQRAAIKLKEQLSVHAIERHYIAIVSGKPNPREGTWSSYLFEDAAYHMHSSDHPSSGGELAVTHYRTLATQGDFSILYVTLATGKKNQIRVHCQRANIPVVGDSKYGGNCKALPRLALHACTLQFIHPTRERAMQFTSPVPRIFTRLVPAKLWVNPPIRLEGNSHGR